MSTPIDIRTAPRVPGCGINFDPVQLGPGESARMVVEARSNGVLRDLGMSTAFLDGACESAAHVVLVRDVQVGGIPQFSEGFDAGAAPVAAYSPARPSCGLMITYGLTMQAHVHNPTSRPVQVAAWWTFEATRPRNPGEIPDEANAEGWAKLLPKLAPRQPVTASS